MDLEHGAGLQVGTSKGRRRKGKLFIRGHDVVERENRALEMLVKGMSVRAIAAQLEMSHGAVSMMIRRALEYRAKAVERTADQALALILERYERLLERWWPLATGDYVDPDTGTSENPPNPRALDAVLKILAQQADLISRVYVASRKGAQPEQAGSTFTGGIHVHTAQPDERERLTGTILAGLATMRAKGVTIEGHLAEARTTLAQLEGGEADDMPGPPPRTRGEDEQ